METLRTMLSLGTGSLWKGISILLAALLIATCLFSLKEFVSLNSTISDKEKIITAQGEELTKKETKIKELQEKVSLKKAEIEVQNATIAANKADTDKNMKAVNVELTDISKKYRDFLEEVKNWKGDQNASSCDNARAFLNSRSW
jgi:hypothetical protein